MTCYVKTCCASFVHTITKKRDRNTLSLMDDRSRYTYRMIYLLLLFTTAVEMNSIQRVSDHAIIINLKKIEMLSRSKCDRAEKVEKEERKNRHTSL